MFVTKKEFQTYQVQMGERHDRQMHRYWELVEAHERLLEHLGLHETKIRAHTVLRSKGGPEEEGP